MNGIIRIKKMFEENSEMKIMTHIVGGYPDISLCKDIILKMAECGADMIEIQLPFSDPSADGPVIVEANHKALKNGTSTADVLSMIADIRTETDIPLFIMSYLNPLFVYGIDKVISKAIEIGVDGFIVPDCSVDETEFNFSVKCNDAGLAFVPLIAPSTSVDRMKKISNGSLSPFVYAVLRLGVTGRKTELDVDSMEYLKSIKSSTGKKIAAGFGISEKKQLDMLDRFADCGIIGSAILRTINNSIAQKGDVLRSIELFFDKLGKKS